MIKKPEIGVMVQQFLYDNGIQMTLTARRNQSMLYIKRSDLISDFLAFLGGIANVFWLCYAKYFPYYLKKLKKFCRIFKKFF